MNKQLNLLLDDSLRFYRGRQLKKALNTAQIALEFGSAEASEQLGLAKAYLLLANIYNTNGLYQNDPSFFSKAIAYLEEAKSINSAISHDEVSIGIALAGGRIYLNSKDFDRSKECFEEALRFAQAGKNLVALVIADAGFGNLCIANNDVAGALVQARKIEELLIDRPRITHPHLWSEMYQLFSQSYILQQDYSRSLEMSQALLQVAKTSGDVEKEVVALRNIAVVSGVKSNYKIGMQYFLEALDKCENIGYREMAVQIQINIGTLYAHLYNYDEAIKRYENVLGQHSDMLDPKTKTVVFNNLGNIYLTSDQPETALDFFEKANHLASQNDFSELLAYSVAQLGRTKIALDRFDEAKQYAETARLLFEQLSTVNGKQINLLNLARLAYEESNFDLSYEMAIQAAELSKQIKDDASEIRAYKQLALIFKVKGMFEQAFEYQERYLKIQEAFAKVQRTRHNLDMEIRHAIREQQKEIELLTKENEYQSRLLQQGEQIARQNDELLRVNEDLRQFAYIASHDLKEPLRMIGSFTQLIHKIAKPHLAEKDQEYFKYVGEGVTRMNNLLDGLLRYSVINQTQEEVTDVQLNDIMAICMANLKIRIIETNSVIERGELPTLKGTQQLYVQLFQNLLANGIKFVPSGINPYIKITAEETAEVHIINVTDNGIGISEENQSKIFEIFKRLHHQSEYEGTGIGLAICQKIAKRLGGSITVKSELGNGATFSLVLPKGKVD